MREVTGEGRSTCGLLVSKSAGSVDVEVQGIHANRGGRITVTDAPPSTGDTFQLERDRLPVQLPLQRAGKVADNQFVDAAVVLPRLLKWPAGGPADIQAVDPGISAVDDQHEVPHAQPADRRMGGAQWLEQSETVSPVVNRLVTVLFDLCDELCRRFRCPVGQLALVDGVLS